MKKLAIILGFMGIIFMFIAVYYWGYQQGIAHATTAEGYINNTEFFLVVDENIYVWNIEE